MSAKPKAEFLSTRVICKQPGRYIGWPTIAKTSEGELLAVFSGDRDAHVCPWGKTQMVRSQDNGTTWSEPETINDTLLDDRDAGIIELADGSLLVSWFTSVAFTNPDQLQWMNLPEAVIAKWQSRKDEITPELQERLLGNRVCRSTDNGQTWSEPIESIVTAPHGPALLADGTLMYVGINQKVGDHELPVPPDDQLLAAAASEDNGKSWKITGYIPVPDYADPGARDFHEPHVVENQDGTLIAMFRYHGTPGTKYLWQTESSDKGRTWTPLHQTAIFGYPPHLLRLSNGWLVVSYGVRDRKPQGEKACISRDSGKTWDVENEILLSEGPNGDLGYPASVELDDGSILTVYYQVDQPGEKTCLMTTHWRLGE